MIGADDSKGSAWNGLTGAQWGRSFLKHRTLEDNLQEVCCEILCTIADAQFQGIQKGDPSIGLESIILFCPIGSGKQPTLALRASEISVEAIQEKLRKSHLLFHRS